jgi:glycosyltransferase involved in cell wall biosynthesis
MNFSRKKEHQSLRLHQSNLSDVKLTVGMIVMSYYPEPCGGAERQCSRLISELLERGHRVIVLTTRARKETSKYYVDGKLEIIRVPKIEALLYQKYSENGGYYQIKKDGKIDQSNRQQNFSKARLLAAKAIQYVNISLFMVMSAFVIFRLRSTIDVWHFHVASLISGWCRYWANYHKIPLVCKGANLPVFPEEPVMPLRKLLFMLRKENHFVALTEEMREDLLINQIPRDKITLIPNGVYSLEKGARSDPGVAGKVIYVANFTQPVANKAFDVLFAAWLRVHKSRPSARLAVAGAGDVRIWKDFLSRNKADSSVDFLGYVEDMQQLYSQALVMVLPSRCEGVSNALLEAQAAGVPAIVSDIPGNRLVVEDGETGYIVSVDDVRAIGDAIVTLWDDVDLRVTMGQKAYSRIAEKFSMQAITDSYLALYSQLCISAPEALPTNTSIQ